MKHALLAAISLAPLACAGAETVTITPAQPAAPPAEVIVDARPAPAPKPTAEPAPKPEEAPAAKPEEAPKPADGEKDGAQFGMIGLLNAGHADGDPKAPWGRSDVADDPLTARGNMWGAANLGGDGIGLGSVGTGQGFGMGRLGGSHGNPPKVKMGAVSVSGRLPPEVIQRIVRQNFGRFRLCYENGLRNNPNLLGRVSVRFTIERDGSVASVGNGGSDMPDANVVSCVVRAFYGLSFPQPEGGKVVVTYPIHFSPPTPATPKPAPPAAPAKKDPPPPAAAKPAPPAAKPSP